VRVVQAPVDDEPFGRQLRLVQPADELDQGHVSTAAAGRVTALRASKWHRAACLQQKLCLQGEMRASLKRRESMGDQRRSHPVTSTPAVAFTISECQRIAQSQRAAES
jgi:hypothetical protein